MLIKGQSNRPRCALFPLCLRSKMLLLLLFRHSSKTLNTQKERMATSPLSVTRLHLPHAIVVRLHMRKINVVILLPEKADSLSVRAVAYPCWWDFPSRTKPWMFPGPSHRRLTTMWPVFTCSLNWELRRELVVDGTPIRFPTNSL